MQRLWRGLYLAWLAFATTSLASPECKVSPYDSAWPSVEEWASLNQSVHGCLLKTSPVASSCYAGDPFNSPHNCSSVKQHWSSAAYHASWPESIDYSMFANNSCLPPGADGYSAERGCRVGGLPQYIVNATTENQIANAMAWASRKGIRIVVKGTGHDLSGRSTGAYSLLIWTHNLNHIEHRPTWHIPGTQNSTDVLICGSGNNWGRVYTVAHNHKRTVVGGEDATVGLGGLIQNGGHGLLSSHYGLASDHVLQVTVVTTDGRRLVANYAQNKDLFWAVRGGGGGQYGIVTEFVLRTHPVPSSVVTGGLTFYSCNSLDASEQASFAALADVAALVPELMDTGLTGTITAVTKEKATGFLGLDKPVPGVAVMLNLISFNQTTTSMNTTLHRIRSQIANGREKYLNFTWQEPLAQTYWSFTKPELMASNSAGAVSMMSSRLMGRRELVDIAQADLITYLRQVLISQNPASGGMLLFGLQGGPGSARVPIEQRGSVLPAWRSAYAHVMAYGASINATGDPRDELEKAAAWYEANIENVWRKWAPDTGSYMNEGNAFSRDWKKDFYGDNYDALLAVKRKYDPSESLFVWSGVGSDLWRYDLRSGLLCRVKGP
ncbi:Berberine and berberine like protein [Aspergillus sclerotialis]|uniref:Berberine and berberine like protein n=1 Tax=Aspergillus sclerotialis TaxID=2070753 RepID=A0A3A2Z9N4_9EURO|nr:Berberine and berberine like protein [Aspergillus sclerotialis]